jgi:hypothetical protein
MTCSQRRRVNKGLESYPAQFLYYSPKKNFHIASFFFSFFKLLFWGYTVIFTKFLQYVIVEFTLSIILLYPSPSTRGIISIGLIFLLTYMCIQFLHHIHPMTSYWYYPSPPDSTCSVLLLSIFVCLRWL